MPYRKNYFQIELRISDCSPSPQGVAIEGGTAPPEQQVIVIVEMWRVGVSPEEIPQRPPHLGTSAEPIILDSPTADEMEDQILYI